MAYPKQKRDFKHNENSFYFKMLLNKWNFFYKQLSTLSFKLIAKYIINTLRKIIEVVLISKKLLIIS